MANYSDVIVFSFLGSLFAFTSAFLLIRYKKTAKILAAYATPFAAGALLAAVFFDLLPESINQSDIGTAMIAALGGMILFFYLEQYLRWFHHHHEHIDSHDSAPKSLIVIGDLVHNSLDGVAIAAAFLVSVSAGIVAVIAIAAHEVPQEIGNIGLLLARGMSRKKAMLVNFLSVITTVLAAIIIFAIGSVKNIPLGALLGVSAGFLLYIAASDVIPLVHKQSKPGVFNLKPFLLLLGIAAVGICVYVAQSFGV